MKTCVKCGIQIKVGKLCQTCAKYQRNGGVWHPLPAYGTVAYDEQGRPICHICGMALDKLIEHTKRKHGLDSESYRKEFGLMQARATSLTSPKYSSKMRGYAEKYETWKPNFGPLQTGMIENGRRKNHSFSAQEAKARSSAQSYISRQRPCCKAKAQREAEKEIGMEDQQ